jgi:hypothetical protein
MPETTPKPEIEGVGFLVLGSFNPAIYHPVWFSNNGLIRKEEAEQATVQIVCPQAASFSAEWFSLTVTPESFSIETCDPTKSHPVRDLTAGTFKILEHTPIRYFGFNRSSHFKLESEEIWHTFGHRLTPKEAWQPLLLRPGLRSLMIQGNRENCDAEAVHLRVEPSVKFQPGIFIHANQQYKLTSIGETMSREHGNKFLKTLQEDWNSFLSYSEGVSQHLFSKYLTPQS